MDRLYWRDELLDFWFRRHGFDSWFRGGAAFDAEVGAEWGERWRELQGFPADHFLTDARTALAATILFDQVPRNIFRGHADAFATDTLALAIAEGAVEREFDAAMTDEERLFLYLPFQHSEEIEVQRMSIRLFASIGNADWLGFAQKHFAIIDRFGRFPHRNAALGRKDREGEAEAIAEGSGW